MRKGMFSDAPFGAAWIWWIMLGLFVLRLGFVTWSLNKGIDITDESWYLIAYRFPSPDLYPIHQYQRVISSWLPIAMDDLVTARAFRVITDLSSIFFLSIAFSRIVSTRIRPSSKVRWIYPFLMLSQVFSISLFSRAFGYTDFSLMNLSFAFSFLVLGLTSGKPAGRLGWLLLSGFFCGLQLFIKYPPALVAGSIMLVFLLVISIKGRIKWWMPLTWVGGMLLAPALFFSTIEGISPWLEQMQQGIEGYKMQGHDPLGMVLTFYVPDYAETLGLLGLSLVIFLLLFLPRMRRQAGEFSVPGTLMRMLLILSLATLATWFYFPTWIEDATTYPLIPSVFCQTIHFYEILTLLLLVAYLIHNKGKLPLSIVAVSLVTIFISLCLNLGSDGTFSVGHFQFAFLLIPGIYLGGYLLALRFPSSRIPLVSVIVVVLLGNFQFVYSYLLKPYRLHQNLFYQTETSPLLPGITLDKPTAEYFNKIDDLLVKGGYQKGDPFITVPNLPGLVYVFDGSPEGSNWYGISPALNCYLLHSRDRDLYHRPPFIIMEKSYVPLQWDCLSADVDGFPEHFFLADSVPNPISGDTDFVYLPRGR